MTTIETSRCRHFDHPEFCFRVDPSSIIEPDLRFLVHTLEDWVEQGERFKDGETIQLGWGMMLVRENANRTMSLWEPDFVHMPIQWVDSVTSTLLHLRVQKDVCESYLDFEQAAFPSLMHAGIACARLGDAEDVVMERQEPEASDSGWFIGCGHDDHDHDDPSQLQRVSLYEAVLRNRSALPYLALPAGVLLATRSGVPAVFYEKQELRPRAGSYIDALRRIDPANTGQREGDPRGMRVQG